MQWEAVRTFFWWVGMGWVRAVRSRDTTALLITLGIWHRVPCKKVEYRQPEGASLLPQRCCFWDRRVQKAEDRG